MIRRILNWFSGCERIQLPKAITLVESNYWLDGGSTTLHAVSESGRKHQIHLTQRLLPESTNPGRLYFDHKLIAVRSNEETVIIELLRNANVDAATESPAPPKRKQLILSEDIKAVMENSPADNIESFREQIIKYLLSDDYLEMARMGKVSGAG